MSAQSILAFPGKILRGNGSLGQLLPTIAPFATRVFIVGGHHALNAVMTQLNDSNEANKLGLKLESQWFGGEVSASNIERLVAQAQAFDADIIFAVGGGKGIDTGKLVAEKLSLPVATIPTIAATCACISSVSVTYDDNGHYEAIIPLSQGIQATVMDPELIAAAPQRWLAAGLGDTLAKLYEYRVISGGAPEGSLNMAAFANGQLCFDIIKRYGPQSIEDVNNQQAGYAIEQVMDAIFIYAGLTSIMGVGEHVAAAHGLYDGFTALDKTRTFGHGLLVGFGNLCLLVLEGRADSEVEEAIKLAHACGVPIMLSQIAELSDAELETVAQAAVKTGDMQNMPEPVSADELIAAMKTVTRLSENLNLVA